MGLQCVPVAHRAVSRGGCHGTVSSWSRLRRAFLLTETTNCWRVSLSRHGHGARGWCNLHPPPCGERDVVDLMSLARKGVSMGRQFTVRRALLAGLGLGTVLSYPLVWRHRCLTWGATPEEAAGELAGDKLLTHADLISTPGLVIVPPPPPICPRIL